jgi:DNA ligase-1
LALFRPLMLANPLEEGELETLDPADYLAEWKWDGIRVQAVSRPSGERRLFSRTGDDVGRAFPDLLEQLAFDAVIDGELLVGSPEAVAPFNDLQQRLNRKTVTARMVEDYPAFLRAYDILFEGGEDLRGLPFAERRQRLEAWHRQALPVRIDLSPLVPFARWEELAALRNDARTAGIEGLMLKRKDSPYVAGRPRGPWFKWKRGALTADLVLMYAQRGHGKRSSYYSDYTFGAWAKGPEGGLQLTPVGKAYFGFTDEELRLLDEWVRDNTVDRFGPVRAVRPGLVLEVAFDSIHASKRHKSGLAMRFPRIHRIRWDKPVAEADRLETLAAMTE